MPRGPRKVYEGAIVNVTSRGNNKKIIFRKDKDYLYFKNLLFKYKTEGKIKIYHYCLMRNHVHLVLKIADPATLSSVMQRLQLAYFYCFKRRYGYVGRFWQGRFYSKLIDNEAYLLTAGLYVEGNPVRAKLVKNPEEYKWSSYNTYAHGIKDVLVELDPYYLSLSDNPKERQEIYREIMWSYLAVENKPL